MHPAIVTLFGVLIIAGAFVAVFINGTDDAVSCETPETVSRFRGIGIGAGTIYTRALARTIDLDPPQTTPNPDLVSWTFTPPAPDSANLPRASNLLWAWLQFIGHDVSHARPVSDAGTIYAGDTAPTLQRDAYVLDSRSNRQQINYASPYIDLSQIYGNDLATFTAMRRSDGSGKLKTQLTPETFMGDDEVPLYNTTTGRFIHLDPRYAENPLVMALYVLFVREHNYWAETLAADEPHLNEHELFNLARHITIAEVQSITYNDFMQMMIGGSNDLFSGTCFTDPSFRTDDDIAEVIDEYLHRTTVYNEWSMSVLPVYQTLMPDSLEVRDDSNTSIVDMLSLADDGLPAQYAWENGVGGILLGAARQEAELRDTGVVDAVREHNGDTIDLTAVQIGRGRDHQIPPYQAFYKLFFGRRDIECTRYAYNTDLCPNLEAVYGVDADIDLLTGVFAEKQSSKSILGPVASELFIKQFGLIRRNDYYFYLWDKIVSPYRLDIHGTTLRDIIARNTNVARVDLPRNVFKIA